MSAPNPSEMIGVTAIKPVERHGMEAVSFFLYDPDTGAIMGRTPKSWGLITAFYLVYYTLLAAFWALMLFIFFQTIDNNVPRWTTDESIIGSSPALGIRPSQAWELIDSSMITFNKASKESTDGKVVGWQEWVDRSSEFLAPYATSKGVDCSKVEPKANEFCKFDLKNLGPCGKGNYGYDAGKPCIFVKLNKIYDLIPTYYNKTADLPEEFPAGAKQRMAAAANKNQVWIDCHGENTADVEGMGPIRYFPAAAGYESQFFPYHNQPGYLSPLIAVQFQQPAVGQLLHLECRAYAGNIGYHRRDKLGRAHFEILIQDDKVASKDNKEL